MVSLADQAKNGKSKKGSSRAGESGTERHQQAVAGRSQPLNLSQVTTTIMCDVSPMSCDSQESQDIGLQIKQLPVSHINC